MIEIQPLAISDVLLITPKRFRDRRGFFSEAYNKKAFAEAGIKLDFVQDNHSMSLDAGTVRGLHFQTQPMAQDKLIRVIRGSILDVAVDIRRSSATFGKWVSAEITAERGEQILIPKGFAHGMCTLESHTEVLYKVTEYYSAEHDSCIRWDDPEIGIRWPLKSAPKLSDRDARSPLLQGSAFIP